MLSNTGKKKRILSFVIALTLVLGNFTFAASQPKAQFRSFKEENKNILKEKIHKDVRKALDKDGSAEVLVYFKDRVDPQKVAKVNALGKTPYEQKLSSRRALLSALKDKAETTQYDLIKYLEQEKEEGKVSEFESFHIVNMVYLKGEKDIIENIAFMEEVEMIYPNRKVDLIKPDKIEPLKTLESTEGLEWNIERVGANLAWDLGYDGTGAVVGMIDTGADWTHEALKEKWRGYNPADPDNPNPEGNWFDAVNGRSMPYDIPEVPHGSHVMGTVLGQDPEGANKIGMAPGAKWIAAKAFTEDGGYDNWLIAAGEWMLEPGGDPNLAPDVINNSWSGGSGRDDWYRDMVESWREAGIVPVFSAGNERGRPAPPASISNPANYPESFAVGATDRNNLRASFSQRGPAPYGDDIKPDITAPGVGIRSSVPGGYEGGWNGTSMSSPHITGAVALLLSADSSLSVERIEEIIKDTATPLTDNDYPEAPNYGYGYGLLNIFDAISEVSTGTGTIKGKVLIDGEDIEDPEIHHDPIDEDCFIGSDIPIEARITDDVSIVEAELMIKTTGTKYWYHVPMTRTSGDVKDGIYESIIPAELIKVPGFEYKIKARDYDGNIVYTDDYSVKVKFGIVPGEYDTDFENYPIGWTLDGEWEWGEPVGEPIPHSGTKLVGTALDGNYSSSSDSLLITPPIDLRDENLPTASLRLFHWYETENRYDKGQVYITNDYGENWIPIGPEYTGEKKEWEGLFVDLNEYIGSKDPVFVAFRLTSDVSGNRLGWYIDDVSLVGEDTEAPSIPTGLKGEVKAVGTSLEWNPSPEIDVDGYKVYRSETSGGEYTLLGETKTNKYFDTTVESDTNYYYVVTASDFAGNESEYSEEIGLAVGTIDLIYSSDFEQDNGGFVSGGSNDTWEWGVPTSGPGTALIGEKVWATILDGKYLNNSNSWIESEEISLPAEGNPILYFNHWYQTESPRFDKCQIHVSGENGVWTNITPDESFGGRIEEWTETELSLDEYQGENIKIRFVFISDYSLNYDGWYIDNVIVANLQEGQESKIIDMPTVIKEDYTLEELEKQGKLKEGYKEPKELDHRLKTNTISRKNNYKKVDEEILMDVKYSAVPVDGVITVLETGRSVRTNLATGTYELKHGANKPGETWTLRAVAHGYYPEEVKVTLEDGAVIRQNFKLDPIPRGDIVGNVIDRFSGETIPNAYIRLVEDTTVEPVYSDENGNFTMPDVLEGSYTLKVVADGYEPGEIEVDVVGNETNRVEIPLKRFVGYEEEIIYDDGTAENALVLNGANNGLAIRVTPSQYGKVKGTNIFFWGSDWPSPGGNEIGIAVFDTDGKGNPTEMIGEPKIVTVNRGEWNYIDLSDLGFSTDRDFFIGTMQTKIGDLSPGVGIDENTSYGDRSYLHLGGEDFVPLSGEGVQGGLMIRGIMEYSLDTPLITNLDEINFTNKDSITIEGEVTSDSIVNVYINGSKIDELETEDRKFTGEIELPADENSITVTATLDGKETEPSAPIMVIKDKEAPEVNISSPEEGEKTNKEVITVKGNVNDINLDKVLINGEKVEIAENGDFSKKIILDNGENIINIVATDLAGNETIVERKIYVGLEAPTITDIMPNEDLVVKPGEEVEISFRSETTGGKGFFEILLPLNIARNNGSKIEMIEVEPGYYKATWIVPENINIKDGIIKIEFTDEFGNTTREEAPGKLTIGTEPGEEIELPELTKIKPNKDETIKTGNKLKVSFRSERGGTAYFTIKHPDGDIKVDMKEGLLLKGRYTGDWKVPEEILGEDLEIEITFINKDGVEVKEIAPGKITIEPKTNKWWFW